MLVFPFQPWRVAPLPPRCGGCTLPGALTQHTRRNQLPPTASFALTLFTDGDRRVPPAPKLALRLLRALQGITKITFEDNDVHESVRGLQPSHSSILDLWSLAAGCWKRRAQGTTGEVKPIPGADGHCLGAGPAAKPCHRCHGHVTLIDSYSYIKYHNSMALIACPYWGAERGVHRGRWSSSCPWDHWPLPLPGDLDCSH